MAYFAELIKEDGESLETLYVDLLTGLMHLADVYNFDFHDVLYQAYGHHLAEVGGRI